MFPFLELHKSFGVTYQFYVNRKVLVVVENRTPMTPESSEPSGFNETKKASEFNFNESDQETKNNSKFETDRPANKQEEDLQLEVSLFIL